MWNKSKTLLASLPFVFAIQSPEEFLQRRAALAIEVQDGAIFLEGNNPSDLDLRYAQDDDFYYLSGVESSDSAMLLLCEKGKIQEEILFLPEKNPLWERWNGTRLAPGEEASKQTGFKKTLPNSKRSAELQKQEVSGKKIWRIKELRAALDSLQVIKSVEEIARIEKAIRITERSFEQALSYIKEGAFEYEFLGKLEGGFLTHGAQGYAFPSIVGSGPNTCRLHYESAQRQMQQGELVVIDVGAKYRHYCADITRTLPVSGKFSPRQAEIYNLVLEAQKRGIAAAKPGVKVSDVHQAAWKFLDEKKHAANFWHGTSHFLGFKVHDTGTSYEQELEPGMVITVEPGIYLPEENLGVRIEDDILITEDGCRVLSNGLPKEIPEIEAWMRKNKTP